MTTCATSLQLRKSDPRPKNRVVGLGGFTYSCTWSTWSQTPELHQEIETQSTTTVSGVFCWLSKDPIGIAGGLNQYVAFGNNPVNFVDPYGLLWLQIIAPIVGGSLNAIEHYDAFVSGDMSGADYSQSIVFGAGAAFLSSFIPGVSGVLVGGIMAGVNDAYNQSLDPNNSGIDIGQSGQAAVIGTVVGLFTYSGQALFVNVVGMPDQIGQVLGSQGSLFHNYSDWGGVMGFLGGTLLTPGGGSQNANTCGGP